MIDTENPSEPETKTTETENTTSILEGKLPVKGSIPDTRLPVKTKQELLR